MQIDTDYEKRALDVLKKAGYRITMPRVQVIRALAGADQALTAYGLHDAIVTGGGKIDVVSVYRILETLRTTGLIYEVGKLGGAFVKRELSGSHAYSTLLVDVENRTVRELAPLIPIADLERAIKPWSESVKGFQLEIVVAA